MSNVPQLTKTQRASLNGMLIGISNRHIDDLFRAMDSPKKPQRRRTRKATGSATPKRDAAMEQLRDAWSKLRWASEHGLATAFHEAGHIEVARALGVRVEGASVHHSDGTGYSEIYTNNSTPAKTRAAIAIAGSISELRHLREPLEGFLTKMSPVDKRHLAGMTAETIFAGFELALATLQKHSQAVAFSAYRMMHHGEINETILCFLTLRRLINMATATAKKATTKKAAPKTKAAEPKLESAYDSPEVKAEQAKVEKLRERANECREQIAAIEKELEECGGGVSMAVDAESALRQRREAYQGTLDATEKAIEVQQVAMNAGVAEAGTRIRKEAEPERQRLVAESCDALLAADAALQKLAEFDADLQRRSRVTCFPIQFKPFLPRHRDGQSQPVQEFVSWAERVHQYKTSEGGSK